MREDYFAALTLTGDIWRDVQSFLSPRRPDTWQHVQAVAEMAERLAARFAVLPEEARLAGLCHDLAAVVPKAELIAVAAAWGVPLTAADRQIPQVLHGPIAAAVVGTKWPGSDQRVLDAIRYHTTLRAGAGVLEKIVFVADKIAYDPTTPRTDYMTAIEEAAQTSLDAAAFAYLDFVITHQTELGWKLHPNLLAAHRDLAQRAAL